jgi:hypothetical protein
MGVAGRADHPAAWSPRRPNPSRKDHSCKSHGFSIGQSVELVPGKYDGNVPPGAYAVRCLPPNDGADREYRVRHQPDGHEGVVRESQFRRSPASFVR